MKKIALALVAALVGAAALSASASAQAVVMRQTFTNPISDAGLTDGCEPGATGTIAGTDVVTLQSVQTTTGIHVVGTDVASGRIDWSNGDYTIIGSTDHFFFNAAEQGTTVHTDAHVDFGDFYNAEGVFLFRETFHAAEHFTVNHGVVTRVEFDRGRFHVFGSGCTP